VRPAPPGRPVKGNRLASTIFRLDHKEAGPGIGFDRDCAGPEAEHDHSALSASVCTTAEAASAGQGIGALCRRVRWWAMVTSSRTVRPGE